MTGTNVGVVLIDGRKYRLVVHPNNCTSQNHWHEEPHADGSPVISATGVLIPHHHHDPTCESQPLQATLYADWEFTTRHEHDFTAGQVCPCGTERVHVPQPPSKSGNGTGRMYEYYNPADAQHPDGWVWQRWTKND